MARRPTLLRRGRRAENDPPLRCRICALHLCSCLCAECRPLTLRTRVVVLCHRKEVHKPSNTGRLVPLMLTASEVRIVGARDVPFDARGLVDPTRRTVLLYPSADSQPLCAEDAQREPITLVVPDADWRRAHKMTSRTPALACLPRVHLPASAPSTYRLRHHPDPRYLATFEAIARALGIVEGHAVEEHLLRVFRLMVERTLRSRGKHAGESVSSGSSATNSEQARVPLAAAAFREPHEGEPESRRRSLTFGA